MRLEDALRVMNVKGMEAHLKDLENEASQGNLWETDPQKAQAIMSQVKPGIQRRQAITACSIPQ